jgi:hypothetical protein
MRDLALKREPADSRARPLGRPTKEHPMRKFGIVVLVIVALGLGRPAIGAAGTPPVAYCGDVFNALYYTAQAAETCVENGGLYSECWGAVEPIIIALQNELATCSWQITQQAEPTPWSPSPRPALRTTH